MTVISSDVLARNKITPSISNSVLSRFYFAIASMSKPTLSDRPARANGEVSQGIGWGSDAIVEQLSRLNLRYIAILPGSSYRGAHDKIGRAHV